MSCLRGLGWGALGVGEVGGWGALGVGGGGGGLWGLGEGVQADEGGAAEPLAHSFACEAQSLGPTAHGAFGGLLAEGGRVAGWLGGWEGGFLELFKSKLGVL